jgi:nucleoside-diphosphate-sugar epimerase
MAGAHVVANFALAGGLGRSAIDANHAIIDATLRHSEPDARIVFFSTLAIHGNFDAEGRRSRNAYGDLKLRNERHFLRSIARAGRAGLVLRLGHVCGEEQNISHLIREEIEAGPVILPDPARASNTTHVVAIAESLLAIAEGRVPISGRFDCVNVPTWTWDEVYRFEAARISRELDLRPGSGVERRRAPFGRRIVAAALRTIERFGARAVIDRLLPFFPKTVVSRIKATHSIAAARQEIGALTHRSAASNPATWWPSLPVRNLPGLRTTRELIDSRAFESQLPRSPWPADLA